MPEESFSNFVRSVPIVEEGLGNDLLLALYHQQQSGNLCDVSLVIENEIFTAHKAVLAAFSSYFQTLFDNGSQSENARSKACNVKEIHLSSVKKTTFLPILHFLYTSRLHIYKENVVDILRTSKKLQIASIVEICNNIIDNKTVLPSLNEITKQDPELSTDSEHQGRNNVLYVDLSNCDDEDSTNNQREDIMKQESAQTASKRTTNALGFENLPATHSNGWPIRLFPNDEEARSLSSTKSENLNEGLSETLQVRSVYSISPSGEKKTKYESKPERSVVSSEASCSSALAKHKKLTKEKCRAKKQFGCRICLKHFNKKTTLNRHMTLMHHSDKFTCTICYMKYTSEESLAFHLTTVHNSPNFKTRTITDFLSSLSVYSGNLNPQPSRNSEEGVSSTTLTYSSPRPTVTPSSIETTMASSFLPEPLEASMDEGSSLSIPLPATTLFPSIDNLEELTEFDKSSSNSSEIEGNPRNINSLLSQLQQTTLVYRNYDHSDDDLPTISRVESIQQLADDNIEQDSNISAVCDEKTRDVSIKSDPDQPTSSTSLLALGAKVCSMADTTTSIDNRNTSSCRLIGSVELNENSKSKSNVRILPKLTSKYSQGYVNTSGTTQGSSGQLLFEPQALNSPSAETGLSKNPSISGLDQVNYIGSKSVSRCSNCDSFFPNIELLREHEKRCCRCPFCLRIFSRTFNMRRHIHIYHSKHKAHACNLCGRAYGIKQSLRNHMKTKHGIQFTVRKYCRMKNKIKS